MGKTTRREFMKLAGATAVLGGIAAPARSQEPLATRPIPHSGERLPIVGIGTAVTIEIPELTIQRARTTVTMPDGATLMLGGWKVIEDQDLDSGIPYLNKIPILSFFFGRKGKYLNKQKLVILVKAEIVVPEESEPAVPVRPIAAR